MKRTQNNDTLLQCTDTIKKWEEKSKDYQYEIPTNYRNAVSFPWALKVLLREDGVMRVTHPRELPVALDNEIQKCHRKSKLWKSYEAYIWYRFVPAIKRIGEIMEPDSAERMQKIFHSEGNGYDLTRNDIPRMWFYSYILAYVDSWKELLSKCDARIYDEIRWVLIIWVWLCSNLINITSLCYVLILLQALCRFSCWLASLQYRDATGKSCVIYF